MGLFSSTSCLGSHDRSEVVHALLEARANVNARNCVGETPLHVVRGRCEMAGSSSAQTQAAGRLNTALAKQLLESGADPDAQCQVLRSIAQSSTESLVQSLYTPLMLAMCYTQPGMPSAMRGKQVFELLVQYGANVDLCDKKRNSAYSIARERNCDELCAAIFAASLNRLTFVLKYPRTHDA